MISIPKQFAFQPLALTTLSILCAFANSSAALALQEPEEDRKPVELRLWEGDAPEQAGQEKKDIPTAIVYLPEKSEKPCGAIVIYPGGGYGGLAMGHEGHEIAQWANSMGMAGVIVNYRHRGKGYGHPCPMLDAQRAIRLTRNHASDWGVDPSRVGVMGFSAGGHLTTTVLTHFDAGQESSEDPIDSQSCRPDFGVVCYAVVAFDQPYTHKGSQRNLLGSDASKELVESLSNERQVKKDTPPCFVWHTAEDKVVPAENGLVFYAALVQKGVPAELHIFPKGRHGIGLGAKVPGANQWPELCQAWLTRNGFAK